MKTSVTIRLAAVNAVGFSASTVMPLWLGGIAREFDMPAWFAGAAVVCQLGAAALFTLATPRLFRGAALLPLARRGLLIAAAAYLAATIQSPALFLAACLICGSALGVVLNVTNRLMGSAEHVQQGYAFFVLIEVCFATALFLGCSALIARHGLLAMFPAVGGTALAAWLLLYKLPIDGSLPATAGDNAPSAGRGTALLGLAGFALFFIGLATLNSFMPVIGEAAGLDAVAARKVIGLGMPFGFVGAILARVVGERVKPIVPIAIVVAVLACIAPVLTSAPTFLLFVLAAITLAVSTIFSVPYFFAQLGALDRSGRYAAYGPAMMLAGLATGPSIAVLLDARFGLPPVGIFASALLLLGGLAFARSAGWGRVKTGAGASAR